MTHITRARLALVLIAVAAGVLAASAAARTETAAAPKPIVIGAVVDLTKNMAPFDAPALLAAQLEIKAINKKGGVDGRPLKMVFLNDQLDAGKTKQFAVQMLQKKVDIGWVTCDVNGERRLRANTGDYLYKIADVLEHFSRYVVFEPGDLIAMGAPSGVAVGQPNAEELYLQPGDDMVIGFEGLMSLRTRIVAPG